MQQESVIVFTWDKNNKAERIVPQQIRRQASAMTPENPPSEPVPEAADAIFNINEERKQKIWDESHQAIFQAVKQTEDRLAQYFTEIIQSDDQFMQKIHVTNLFDDLKQINEELNGFKQKITIIPELDDLFSRIREHLNKKDPNITTKGEFLNFVKCTFQIQEEKFEFKKQAIQD
ncbi:hypothetical protein pb186bvf_007542 [Paramecium bursaria]